MGDRAAAGEASSGSRGTVHPLLPSRRAGVVFVTVGAIGLLSCEVGTTSVEPPGGRIENLIVRFDVSPDTVRLGYRLQPVLTIRNPSNVGVTVALEDGCLGEPTVLLWSRHEVPFHFEGPCQVWDHRSAWDDPQESASYTIRPRDSVVNRWSVRAWRWYPESTPPDSGAPQPGSHVFRVRTPSNLPTLDAVFEVLPSGYYWNWMRCSSGEPSPEESIVIDLRAPEAGFGLRNHPFRIYNHHDRDVWIRQVGPRIQVTIQREARPDVWYDDWTVWHPWAGSIMVPLPAGGCIQAWNPVGNQYVGGPGPPGTYRLRLEYWFEWPGSRSLLAYSNSVVLPES